MCNLRIYIYIVHTKEKISTKRSKNMNYIIIIKAASYKLGIDSHGCAIGQLSRFVIQEQKIGYYFQ